MKDGMLIGIDAGTSVIKSVAFTTTGEQIAAAAIPNRYQTLPRWRCRAGHGPHLGRCRRDAEGALGEDPEPRATASSPFR